MKSRTIIEYGNPTDSKYLRSIQQRLKRMSTAKQIKDKYKNDTSHRSYVSAVKTIEKETSLLSEDISQLSSEIKAEKKLAFCFAVYNSDIGDNMDYGVLEGILSTFNSRYGSKKTKKKKKKSSRKKKKQSTKRR
jgi:hypothetical protein